MPNLYMMGAAILGVLALLTGVFFYGQHVNELAWVAKVAEMNANMATAKTTHDTAISDLNMALEHSHAVHVQELAASNSDLRSLAADLDRVRAKTRTCGGNVVQPATVPQGSAPVVQQDHGGFQELVGIMERCAAAASYAEDAHSWATDPAVSKSYNSLPDR